jgi:hypothetical protein
MRSKVENIIADGYPMAGIISKLHDDVVEHTSLKDVDKALICEKLAQVSSRYCIVISAS